MQVKITLEELLEIHQSLSTFITIPLPAKYSYRFQKVAKILQSEWNDFKKNHDNLIRKYGKPNAENTQIQVTPENLANYAKERNEMMSKVISFDFEPIPISLVADSKLSVQDMAALEKFFVDDLVVQLQETAS
jgi:hypothetical protein